MLLPRCEPQADDRPAQQEGAARCGGAGAASASGAAAGHEGERSYAVKQSIKPSMNIVGINPETDEHHAAIARRGDRFWERERLLNGAARLIPVDADGVPWVAEFIFVRPEAIVRGGQ